MNAEITLSNDGQRIRLAAQNGVKWIDANSWQGKLAYRAILLVETLIEMWVESEEENLAA